LKEEFVNKKKKPDLNNKIGGTNGINVPKFSRMKLDNMKNGHVFNINLMAKNNYESPDESIINDSNRSS
jgi:hypothetical protein